MACHIFFFKLFLICKWASCGEIFFQDYSSCIKISYSNFLQLSVNLVLSLTGKPHPISLKGCITGLEELQVSKCIPDVCKAEEVKVPLILLIKLSIIWSTVEIYFTPECFPDKTLHSNSNSVSKLHLQPYSGQKHKLQSCLPDLVGAYWVML